MKTGLTCFKWMYRHFSQDYRVATFSILHLTAREISIVSLKAIDNSYMPKLTIIAIRDGCTEL